MTLYSDILVSVLMPVYNGSLYLKEAIDSILTQTHSNLELIIINDGSIDDSEQIILSYKDSRVKYIRNEQNSGICVTLNKGLDAANGKYIARMDCDDISFPERLQKQVAYMEENTSIGVVGSDIIVFGKDIKERLFTFEHDKYCCKAGLLFNTCFAHPAVMMRNSILVEQNLRYDDSYRGLEDFELWYRMSKFTEIINIEEPLLFYRKHKSQETQNVPPAVDRKLQEFLFERIVGYGDFDNSEMLLVNAYCKGDWQVFNNDNILDLQAIFNKIIRSNKVRHDKHFRKGMQITLSKALALTLMNSSKITLPKIKIYTKALVCGIMPFNWYMKFVYHAIF